MSFSEGGWVLEKIIERKCEEAGGYDDANDEGDNLINTKSSGVNCEFST
jgi:hypothetical protein